MNKELKEVLQTEFIRNVLVSKTSTKTLVGIVHNLRYFFRLYRVCMKYTPLFHVPCKTAATKFYVNKSPYTLGF